MKRVIQAKTLEEMDVEGPEILVFKMFFNLVILDTIRFFILHYIVLAILGHFLSSLSRRTKGFTYNIFIVM